MKKIFVLAILLFNKEISSQSLMQYTLAPMNTYLYNPSKAGLNKGNLFFHHKSQYIGISPINFSNQSITFDLPIYKINSGWGFVVNNDFSGFLANTSMILNYAYHLPIKKSKLSFGIGVGMNHLYLNGSKLRVASGDYDIDIVHNDKILDNDKISSLSFDIDLGMNFETKKFSGGVSMKNVLNHGNTIFKNNSINTSRVLVSNFSYEIKLIENLIFTPGLLFKTDFVKYQSEFIANFKIKQNFYAGFSLLGYNTNNFDGLGIFIGAQLSKKIKLIYNYDVPLSALKGTNNGSHEILFQYNFDLKNRGLARYYFDHNSRYL